MRIVHVTDGYLPRLGGIELHVRDLAAAQAAEGHDVTVVTTTPGSDARVDGVAIVRPCSAATEPSGRMQHTWVGRALRSAALATADTVHIHTSMLSPLAFTAITAASDRRIPTVVTMHSMVSRAACLLRVLSRAQNWRRRAVVWTAVSTAAAYQFGQVLDGDLPVQVLPNGIDPTLWRATQRTRDPAHLAVVCAGRLAARKRPGALLRILAAARRRIDARIGMRLVLVGDGPERDALRRYVAQHDMSDWVTFVGFCSRAGLRELYAGADLYLAPATLESFGLAALEARCSGLPVLAHSGSGVADFVEHDVDGVLAGSDAAMTAAVVRLAHDPLAHQRMLRAAAAHLPSLAWRDVLPLTYETYEAASELVGRISLDRVL